MSSDDQLRLVTSLLFVITGTLTVTESSGTDSVVEGGTLELTCTIPNWIQTAWNIPGHPGVAVCNCLSSGQCVPDTVTGVTCGTVLDGVSIKLENVAFSNRGEYICRDMKPPYDQGTLNIVVIGKLIFKLS